MNTNDREGLPTEALGTMVGLEVDILMRRQRKTRHQLAELLNVSAPTVGRRLNGEIEFRLEELKTVAEWLGVPVARLIDPDCAPVGARA